LKDFGRRPSPVARLGGIVALVALVIMSAAVLGCSKGTKVTRVDETVVTDFSGRWNDTDSRLVATEMVKQALASPWLENYTREKGRQPVVIVGTIANRSHEHINMATFVDDLARALTNSEKVVFVAAKGEREELREERRDQAVHAREDTQKAAGKEQGADYMLRGNFSTILDEADGIKGVYYQVDLEVIDLENNVKAWMGQKKIKKVVERKRVVF
jgi:uncharacterized protein (TIGR02722 family)